MPISGFIADAFRDPPGDGTLTPLVDGDGFYVAQSFDEHKTRDNSSHLGADWNGEGGGNTDLGQPGYGIGDGTVVAVVSNQGGSTTGFGSHVVLRHDLAAPITVNGQRIATPSPNLAPGANASSSSEGAGVDLIYCPESTHGAMNVDANI